MLHKMLDTTMLKHTMLHTNTCVTYNMTRQRLWFVVQCGVGEIQSVVQCGMSNGSLCEELQ